MQAQYFIFGDPILVGEGPVDPLRSQVDPGLNLVQFPPY
jgi:hypothetical protein